MRNVQGTKGEPGALGAAPRHGRAPSLNQPSPPPSVVHSFYPHPPQVFYCLRRNVMSPFTLFSDSRPTQERGIAPHSLQSAVPFLSVKRVDLIGIIDKWS